MNEGSLKDPIGELRSSISLLGDSSRLRARLEEDGYLYLPKAFPSSPLASLRGEILDIFADKNWLKPGVPAAEGRSGRMPVVEGEDDYFRVYDELQKLESFHTLAHHPKLLGLMREVVGPRAFPHPLGVARLVFPDNGECTTPAHQDFPNNQGTRALYAAWMPLADCPQQAGGLSILEGSQKLGLLPLEFSLGAGGRQARLPQEAREMRWLSADFQCGDVLVFGSMTVHRSLPNLTADQFRLSVDYRYQEEGSALTDTVLQPHFGRLSWDEVYADWRDRQFCYYWHEKDYEIVPWNEELHALPAEHLSDAVRESRAWQKRRREKYL